MRCSLFLNMKNNIRYAFNNFSTVISLAFDQFSEMSSNFISSLQHRIFTVIFILYERSFLFSDSFYKMPGSFYMDIL